VVDMSRGGEKGIQEKLKSFFRGLKTGGVPKPKVEEFVIVTEEIEGDLRPESPLQNRLKTAKELVEVCKSRKVENVRVI